MALVFILAGTAQGAPGKSGCVKSVLHDKSQDVVFKRVQEALHSSKTEKLLSYAYCKFLVGVSESEAVGFVDPIKVLPEIQRMVGAAKWVGNARLVDKDRYELMTTDASYFLLVERDSEGWYWAGFLASDSEPGAKLLKSGGAKVLD